MAENTGHEIATAYVSIVPSVRGMDDSLRSQLSGDGSPLQRQAHAAGTQAGDTIGSRITERVGAALAGVAIGDFLLKSIAAAEESVQATARLDAVARSMGGGVQYATDRLKDYAGELSKSLAVEDESILAVQTKLLTFQALADTADQAGGALDRATKAAFDLAAAGFGSAESNAVQLGKALQDPVKGMTALARSGVTFTEAEKARIQTLAESNRLGEAQAIILAAVEKQVGGVAEASVTATARISRVWGEVQEQVGTVLLPAVEAIADELDRSGTAAGGFLEPLLQASRAATALNDQMARLSTLLTGTEQQTVDLGANILDAFGAGTGEVARIITNIETLIELLGGDVVPRAHEAGTAVKTLADLAMGGGDGLTTAGSAADDASSSFTYFATTLGRVKGAFQQAAAAGQSYIDALNEARSIQASMEDMRFEASLRGLDQVTAAQRRLAREQEQLNGLDPGSLDYIRQQREVLAAQIALDDARYTQEQEALADRKAARQAARAEARAAAQEAAAAAEQMRQQAQQISDTLRDSLVGSFGNAPGASAAGMLEGLRIRLQQIKSFAANLNTLAERGTPAWLLNQIADAGIPDGAQMAATLATSSDVDFAKIARAASRVYAAATVAGNAQAARVTGVAPGPVAAGSPVAVQVYIGNEAIDRYVDVRVARADERQQQARRAGRRYA